MKFPNLNHIAPETSLNDKIKHVRNLIALSEAKGINSESLARVRSWYDSIGPYLERSINETITAARNIKMHQNPGLKGDNGESDRLSFRRDVESIRSLVGRIRGELNQLLDNYPIEPISIAIEQYNSVDRNLEQLRIPAIRNPEDASRVLDTALVFSSIFDREKPHHINLESILPTLSKVESEFTPILAHIDNKWGDIQFFTGYWWDSRQQGHVKEARPYNELKWRPNDVNKPAYRLDVVEGETSSKAQINKALSPLEEIVSQVRVNPNAERIAGELISEFNSRLRIQEINERRKEISERLRISGPSEANRPLKLGVRYPELPVVVQNTGGAHNEISIEFGAPREPPATTFSAVANRPNESALQVQLSKKELRDFRTRLRKSIAPVIMPSRDLLAGIFKRVNGY